MKKLILVMAFNIMAIFSQAQNQLELGQEDFHSVVQKPYFHYDALRLQQPSWVRELKGINESWQPESKFVSTYAEPGLFSLLTDSNYNAEKSKWELGNIYSYAYQKNNDTKLTKVRTLSWEETPSGTIGEHSTFKYTYNSNGKLSLIERQQYDSSDSKYITDHISYISYDLNGNRVKDSTVIPGINSYYLLDSYEYNQFGECSAKYYVTSNNGNIDTTMIERMVYDNGKLSRYSNFSNYNDTLRASELIRYSYNENGMLTYAGIFYANGLNQMDLTSTYSLSYTSLGKLAHISSYIKDESSDEMMPLDSIAFSYLGNGDITTSYGYVVNPVTKKWLPTPFYRLTFSDVIANNVNKIQPTEYVFKLYPNPASNSLSIESKDDYPKIKTYGIYNLQGQLVKQGEMSRNIDIMDLAIGTYILKLETENGIYQKRFIKE